MSVTFEYSFNSQLELSDLVDGQWCDLTTREAADPTPHVVEVLRRLDDFPE
jgi:hypothetical protein